MLIKHVMFACRHVYTVEEYKSEEANSIKEYCCTSKNDIEYYTYASNLFLALNFLLIY